MSEPRLEVRHINGRYWDVFTTEGERVAKLEPGVGAEEMARLFAAAPGLLTRAKDLLLALEVEPDGDWRSGRIVGATAWLRIAVAAAEGERPQPASTRPPCKVEGCEKPIAPEGNGQSCPYTCEEHAPGWGTEWGFCGWGGTCYRRAPRGAIRCSLHGGRDYPPAGEPRCEASGCGEKAAEGARYCGAHSGGQVLCLVRGCPRERVVGESCFCPGHRSEFLSQREQFRPHDWLAARASLHSGGILPAEVPAILQSSSPHPATVTVNVSTESAESFRRARRRGHCPECGGGGMHAAGCPRRRPGAPLPVPEEVTTHGAPAGEDTAAIGEALQAAPVVTPEPALAPPQPRRNLGTLRLDLTPMLVNTLERAVERLRDSLWDTWEEVSALPKRCVAGDCGNIRRRGGALCTEHAREVR
jgi:hypothetical protein